MAEERFRAEPLPTENSWRVFGDRGSLVGYRMSREAAEALS